MYQTLMNSKSISLLLAMWLFAPTAQAVEQNQPTWHAAMSQVHARFTGRKGTFAQFGDSITVTMAFWAPLQGEWRGAPPEMEAAYRRVEKYMLAECWRDWKGADFGSDGGQTIHWAEKNVDAWLKKLNPEVALIMFGTNDLPSVTVEEYKAGLEAVSGRCLKNGTIVILSTIPPRHGYEKKAASVATAVREVARDLSIPVVDYHAEILKRCPEDWDGSSEKFAAYTGYDVPTMIARDGVHPSAPNQFTGDYSENALRCNGYALRNYLVLITYADVIGRAVQAPELPWIAQAPELPPAMGNVISVADADGIKAAVRKARPGDTISLTDGIYQISEPVVIATDKVTLRSASGQRDRVVLDGGGTLGEMITLRSCSNVTIADLTVRNVRWNGIKFDSDKGVQRARVRNCVLRNVWQRGIKGVKVPEKNRDAVRPRNCLIEYCLFFNDRPKRFQDDPADTPENFGGNYVGGIDVMYAAGWTIRDNVFVGIRGRTQGARGAVFLWHDARDCLVERNVIIDCDSGICLGNSHKPEEVPVHCTGVTVRNNFVCRAPENGILADYTKDCALLHNTVYDPQSRLKRLVRVVHGNEGLRIANNLFSGPPLSLESSSNVELGTNVFVSGARSFVDATAGDLHLTAAAEEAIDQADRLLEVNDDIDQRPREARADFGADEFRSRGQRSAQ